MKFNYYTAILEEARRIDKDCNCISRDEILERKLVHDKWRDGVMDRLYTDFLPPIERRDLLTLVQNIGYIAYEVREVVTLKSITSAEGVLLREKLQTAISFLAKETEALPKKRCNPKRLREAVYSMLSLWRDCVKSGGEPSLCDGIEAVSEALLKYADTLETICVLM